MGDAIIVTGTPGTGKTTFAIKLSNELGAVYVQLNRYISKFGLYSGYDRQRRTKIVNLLKTRTSLNRLVTSSKATLVLDSHIPDVIIPGRRIRKVFVLRCNPRILESRLKRKKWPARKIRENLLAELLDSCLTTAVECYGRRHIVQLDTSHRSVRRNLRDAMRSLGKGRPSSFRKFDWLTQLDRDGLLHRYLR